MTNDPDRFADPIPCSPADGPLVPIDPRRSPAEVLSILRQTFVTMARKSSEWSECLLHNNRNTDSTIVGQHAQMWWKVVEVFDEVSKAEDTASRRDDD